MIRQPLTKQQVIEAIERKSTNAAIPLAFHKWWGNGLQDKYGNALTNLANQYPNDICAVSYQVPGNETSPTGNPEYRWGYRASYTNAERHSIGSSCVLLPDWNELDQFFASFPNPYEPGNFDNAKQVAESNHQDRYVLGFFWTLFHERLWSIRGMENLMMDYYDQMNGLKKIGEKLVEYYKGIIDQFAALGANGIFASDDLGHQTGPMMSPAIFEELYFPLYQQFISYAHSKGMHVFLHSCGDNTLLLPYLIKAGLDVFHPIQAGCMDFQKTHEQFGNQITFLAGVDVQHLLPEGTEDEVRQGIRSMIDILYKPEGGLLLAAGNGIMPDTPLENIRVMMDEISIYRPESWK